MQRVWFIYFWSAESWLDKFVIVQLADLSFAIDVLNNINTDWESVL